MALFVEDLRDFSLDAQADGETIQRTLATEILDHGAWATLLVCYQKRKRPNATPPRRRINAAITETTDDDAPIDWSQAPWQPPQLLLLRFAKVRGVYKLHAKIALGAVAGMKLGVTIAKWLGPQGEFAPQARGTNEDGANAASDHESDAEDDSVNGG